MPHYQLITRTIGREVYDIIADDDQHAREIYDSGVVNPSVSEVITAEIEHVTEAAE